MTLNIKALFLIICLASFCFGLTAQSSAELKAKREQLLEDIQSNNRQLLSTRKNKAATLEQLAIIQEQIRNREELILTVQSEINMIALSINRSKEVVFALEDDIERLKEEYSHLLRTSYRSRLQNSWLTFLLSSRSFNEAFRRWQYLRQYQRFRSKQARLILATQKSLRAKSVLLESRQQEKNDLLISEQQQQLAINREKNAQDNLLRRLKKSETGILNEIQRQEKARAQLNNAIEKAIATEMARVLKANRLEETPASIAKTNANTSKESSDFSKLQGFLPWPAKGNINSRFGRQPHPTVKGIEITNNGIDIKITNEIEVKCVAQGIVVSTHFVPGYRNMILIRHGNYYTVYSNLETVNVSKGQKIRGGDNIGRISSEAGDLHFEIWKQKERLNPELWVN